MPSIDLREKQKRCLLIEVIETEGLESNIYEASLGRSFPKFDNIFFRAETAKHAEK